MCLLNRELKMFTAFGLSIQQAGSPAWAIYTPPMDRGIRKKYKKYTERANTWAETWKLRIETWTPHDTLRITRQGMFLFKIPLVQGQ